MSAFSAVVDPLRFLAVKFLDVVIHEFAHGVFLVCIERSHVGRVRRTHARWRDYVEPRCWWNMIAVRDSRVCSDASTPFRQSTDGRSRRQLSPVGEI